MDFSHYLAARRAALLDKVPYSALPTVSADTVFEAFLLEPYAHFGREPDEHCWQTGPPGKHISFLYRTLGWDTAFFGKPMARVQVVLFDASTTSMAALAAATRLFTQHLRQQGIAHCYCEVSASDTWVRLALTWNAWALIETRLHYYHTLAAIPADRHAVREATPADSAALRRVSATNPNPHDRFHADCFFGPAEASRFLGEYAAVSVAGYCDKVLVPAIEPLDSFLTINYLAEDAGKLQRRLSRNALAAVGSSNRGWHRRLLTEALWDARARNTDFMLLTTQAANRAVIHNCEVTGFQLSHVTHTISWSTPQ